MTTASISTTAASPSTPASLARAVHRVGQVVTAVLVLAVATAVVVAGVALARGAWMVTPVLSGSMRPGLAVGGAVISERVPVDQLARRDVIVFTDPDHAGELIVHRIVALTRTSSGTVVIRTQGDANPVPDRWKLAVRGHDAYLVRWSVPLLGYLAVTFQDYRGFALQFAGLVLFLVAASTYLGAIARAEVGERRPRPHRRLRRAAGAPRHRRPPARVVASR